MVRVSSTSVVGLAQSELAPEFRTGTRRVSNTYALALGQCQAIALRALSETPQISPRPEVLGKRYYRFSNRHTSGEVQYAFKDSMIHGILQFTLRIAFRCVLHRCESLEIRCQKLFIFK